MNRLIIIVLSVILVLFAGSCTGGETVNGSGPAISPAPAPEGVEQIITRLEQDWVTAILKKDTATLDRVLADDFIGTTDDQSYAKVDAMDDVQNGTHESLELDNVRVRVFGDTAVATMGQTEKSRHGQVDFSGHYLFTDVWTKRNGQWLAVASHGSRAR
jgi:ketosteroid isomerase-like protein